MAFVKKRSPQFLYQLISHRPPKVGSAEKWDEFVTRGLCELFMKEPATRSVKPETTECLELFDRYVIFQAKTMGFRIRYSEIVKQRMQAWELEESGAEKFERLGHAEKIAVLIRQGRSRKLKAPITDPDWKPARKMMIEELSILIGRLSAIAQSLPRRLTTAQFEEHCETIVAKSGFRLLPDQLDNLLDYLRSGDGGWTDKLLRGETVSPTKLHDYWWSTRQNRTPEDFRQEIAKISAKLPR